MWKGYGRKVGLWNTERLWNMHGLWKMEGLWTRGRASPPQPAGGLPLVGDMESNSKSLDSKRVFGGVRA